MRRGSLDNYANVFIYEIHCLIKYRKVWTGSID